MAAKATSAARPLPRRNTRLYVIYGDKEEPDVREGLAKYRPLLEALRSETLSMTIEDLPQEVDVSMFLTPAGSCTWCWWSLTSAPTKWT